MAAQFPVLINRDLNRTKNKKATDEAIPFVYETVITWGCKKKEQESFIDYYNRRPEKLWNDNKASWKKEVEKKHGKRIQKLPKKKRIKEKEKCVTELGEKNIEKLLIKENWTKEEEKKLGQINCKGLDATLLHKLVPTICDGIGRHNPNAPSSTEIEKFLREVKDKRNDICHEPHGASVSATILDELEVSAVNAFKAAGNLYSSTLNKKAVQNKIDELKEKLQKMKEEVMTDDQQRILQTAKKMSVDGKAERKRAVRKQTTDSLPYSDGKFTRSDIYHNVNASMRVEKEDAKSPEDLTTVEFPSNEILQKGDGDIILCEGEPGSGKTTLLRRLQEDYFATGNKLFQGVELFDLLLYMDCRDISLESILQLLKRMFPKTMNQLNDNEALQALHELKLLICVDGLDELNKKSRKLLDELIHTFQFYEGATFVCTSRPGQSHCLRTDSYKTMSLQPIIKEKEQIAFLERYQSNIKGIVAPELIQAFESLVQSCKYWLRQPIYLALFCYLFRKLGQTVCLWRNELALMEQILKLSEKTMITRMGTMDVENPHVYADDVTKAITQLSVELVLRGEVTIDMDTYTDLGRRVFGRAEVSHYSILSSYFTSNADGQSLEVFHKSYLEYLAAKRLFESIDSNPSSSVISAIMSHKQDKTNFRYDIVDDLPYNALLKRQT